ncbi:hypothetical protein ACT691_12760 [Vibrio metschnikovii]
MAWLVTRTSIAGKQLLTILAIVPLAIPGYVMALCSTRYRRQYGRISSPI